MLKLYPYLRQLNSSLHRDLAWLIASPSLLAPSKEVPTVSSQEWWSLFKEAFDWIKQEDQNPQRLQTFIDTPRQFKLGLYAEDLMLYYLRYGSPFEVLAHDLQVFNKKRSIGAFDFILKNPNGSIEHWEMAIKYYLQYKPSTKWIDFVGPAGKDTLQRKMDKMLKRQMLLGHTQDAKHTLAQKNIPLPQTQKVISVGRLFGAWGRDFTLPLSGDPQQPTGLWIYKKDLMQLLQEKERSRWCIRIHPNWLSPLFGAQAKGALSSKELSAFVIHLSHHIMLSELQKDDWGWKETQRWIVVPDYWKRIPDN